MRPTTGYCHTIVTKSDYFLTSFYRRSGPVIMAPRAIYRRTLALRFWSALSLLGFALPGWSAAPLLYRQAAYESPVRGDPDDLLLIAGYGFSAGDKVVYQSLDAGAGGLIHPASIPAQSNATRGTAAVVSQANVPYSLTVRLPPVMRMGQSYALWVVTVHEEWSEPLRINDARPLWFSPSFVYASAAVASLPRYLKVVGRNLEATDQSTSEIRLSGPATLVLAVQPADQGPTALDHYVALVRLPPRLLPGAYRVQVRRDRSGWVDLAGQTLQVRPDPVEGPRFSVSAAAFGGCKADDSLDDGPCVVRAIAAAEGAGGGTVVFGPGVWHLSELSMPQPNGIVVPRGVNLRGAGKLATTIVQEADGQPLPVKTTFTLLGRNEVQGFTFRDAHVYTTGNLNSSFLKLGLTRHEDVSEIPTTTDSVEDVVITGNVFERPHVAISDGGSRIARLFVTYNELGAYRIALDLSGVRPFVNERFGIEDSVIAYNLFKPGSYLATDIRQGAMASELGASLRLDFSHNTADGTATDDLKSSDAARGWRAAFFWHMDDNHEMLLVAQNTATCTGDKDGDGEAISYDGNANTFALAAPATVLAATADSVTIAGPLATRQNDRDIRIPDYYRGHWVQVVDGPGLGQARKIRSYDEDPNTGTVHISVAPVWDVVPAQGKSRLGIGREYWQVYTVANTVDQRQPRCLKSNRTGSKGGGIGFWAPTADSVIEGNRQFDTDGISFRLHYNAEQKFCGVCDRQTSYVDFLEIRDNVIQGEYDWSDDCSSSGIWASLSAGPATHYPPPSVGFGISISHNTITRADGWRGGAISFTSTWYAGPAPHRWPLSDNALVHHNTLLGLDAAPATACNADKWHPRTGISLGGSELAWRTVLYANACPQARRALNVTERDVVRVCPADTPSCECPAR